MKTHQNTLNLLQETFMLTVEKRKEFEKLYGSIRYGQIMAPILELVVMPLQVLRTMMH
jgi:hypothetical protein